MPFSSNFKKTCKKLFPRCITISISSILALFRHAELVVSHGRVGGRYPSISGSRGFRSSSQENFDERNCLSFPSPVCTNYIDNSRACLYFFKVIVTERASEGISKMTHTRDSLNRGRIDPQRARVAASGANYGISAVGRGRHRFFGRTRLRYTAHPLTFSSVSFLFSFSIGVPRVAHGRGEGTGSVTRVPRTGQGTAIIRPSREFPARLDRRYSAEVKVKFIGRRYLIIYLPL